MSSYDDMTVYEIIDRLTKKYKDDPDAIERIERAKNDIEYIKSEQKNNPEYRGQTPKQYTVMFAEMLDWD